MRSLEGGLRPRYLVPVAILLAVVGGVPAAGAQEVVPNVSIVKEVCTTGSSCDAGAATGAGGWSKSATVAPGSEITWRITVANIGNDALLAVSVDDTEVDACDRATSEVPAFAHFGTGESTSYTCSSGPVEGAFTNHVSVAAVGCTCGQAVSAADSASVTIITTTTTTVPGATTTEAPTTTATPTTAAPTTTAPQEVLAATTTIVPPAGQAGVEGRPLAVTGQSVVQTLGIAFTFLVIGAAALVTVRRRSIA